MKIAVCGGDERAARLCALLCGDGHEVRALALDKARLPSGVLRVGCPQGCFAGARLVILPMPPGDETGRLYAPLGEASYDLAELLALAPEGALVCAGGTRNLPEGRYIEDYAAREEFIIGSAAAAAEGALELAMGATDRTLCGLRALVVGYSLMGKLLSSRLRALGAVVTVAAKLPGERALARAMGCRAVRMEELEAESARAELIMSTVPVPGGAAVCRVEEGCFMVELLPTREGGAACAGRAASVAGSCAPQTAAEMVREAVYSLAEEWEL